MKKIKHVVEILFVGLVVIVGILVNQAFKGSRKLMTTKSWFAYVSTGVSAASYQNEANYRILGSRGNCRTANQVCEIFASIITLSISPLVQAPHLSGLSTFGSSVATYSGNGSNAVVPSVIDGVSVDFVSQ